MAGDDAKARVLQAISGTRRYIKHGPAQYRIGSKLVHVRYKTDPGTLVITTSERRAGRWHESERAVPATSYLFDINRNTLRADYELWICGDSDGWYLVPMDVIRKIYHDPQRYVNKHHPEHHPVSVNATTDEVSYAKGGRSVSVAAYRNGRLT